LHVSGTNNCQEGDGETITVLGRSNGKMLNKRDRCLKKRKEKGTCHKDGGCPYI